MQTYTHPRVVVGVDRSLSGLAALRAAAAEARRRGLPLYAIRARTCVVASVDSLAIRTAFREALGGIPADIPVEQSVSMLGVIDALCTTATDPDDLIVVGAGRHSRWRALFGGSITPAVVRRARCAVLAVPEPEMSRSVRPRHGSRGQWDPLRDLEERRPEFRGRPHSGI